MKHYNIKVIPQCGYIWSHGHIMQQTSYYTGFEASVITLTLTMTTTPVLHCIGVARGNSLVPHLYSEEQE